MKKNGEEQFAGARELYRSMETPQELNRLVNAAIDRAVEKKEKRRHPVLRASSLAAVCCCALFVVMLNTSQVFAETASAIPVLGEIARVFTFREYRQIDSSHEITAKIPSVSDTGNAELEERINREVQTRIDRILADAKQRGDEEKKAYLETGGKAEEYQPVTVNVDYSVKRSDGGILSFVVYETEVRASAYTEQLFYNVDLKTGRDITLRDLLGEAYRKIADQSIKDQIAQRAKDPNNVYFDGKDGIPGFSGIGDDAKFYINEAGNPVICFDKYEIAPGYMGIQEFEVKK